MHLAKSMAHIVLLGAIAVAVSLTEKQASAQSEPCLSFTEGSVTYSSEGPAIISYSFLSQNDISVTKLFDTLTPKEVSAVAAGTAMQPLVLFWPDRWWIFHAALLSSYAVGGMGGSDTHTETIGINYGSMTTSRSGNVPAVGNPAGFERSDRASSVPYRSTSQVHELCINGPCFTNWHFSNLSTLAAAPAAASNVSAYIRTDNTSAIVYRTTSNHIEELRRNGTSWVAGDLSAPTNATAATGNPAAYPRSDGYSVVVYRGTNNHIFELALPPGSSTWQVADLSTVTGAPNAASDPVGYVRADGTNTVVYRSVNDGHIRQLSLISNGWQAADLTALTNAHAAAGVPRPYSRSDGFSAVVYRGTDDHIYELRLPPGSSTWQVGDLTALTSAPAATGDPSPYTRLDIWNTVIFRGSSNNHIYELGLAPGSSTWQVHDLTSIAGAPVAADTPSGFVRDDGASTIHFRTSDNHIHELYLIGGSWGTSDLTSLAGGP